MFAALFVTLSNLPDFFNLLMCVAIYVIHSVFGHIALLDLILKFTEVSQHETSHDKLAAKCVTLRGKVIRA